MIGPQGAACVVCRDESKESIDMNRSRFSSGEHVCSLCVEVSRSKSQQPTSVTKCGMWERDRPPCCIHTYTAYTPIGGKGRCRSRCDPQDHSMQARKSAGKISTLDLKPMRNDTRSPKQEQSVVPQNGPMVQTKNLKKKKKKKGVHHMTLHAGDRACATICPGFEIQGRRHQKVKIGVLLDDMFLQLFQALNGLFTHTETDMGSDPYVEGFPLDWSLATVVF